ncbi:hypothetical protein Pla86_14310 [Planctomycetes bacterium Pla86]|uniref:Uncharacterized protein n=1 Tax=Engelhardtia mirabilis TaxID=2528011 RepID=A0A518BHA3_9BACT|nr:hypothetical protein Pla133_14320 [Planctomycetes bacterium Pla133]QDV00688.1 hypothetical protein Pla86_14310 [Planctomycetes bacterium Pla86]
MLDAACGPGTYLAHFGPGSFGLDRDAAVLSAARTRGCEVLQRDLSAAGWSAGLPAFEAVWLCDALVHLPDPGAFLAELRAITPAGTPVAVAEWVLPQRGRLRRALALATPGARAFWAHPEHLHRFTEPDLIGLLDRAGFEPQGRILHSLPAPLRRQPVVSLLAPWLPPRTLLARAR